MEDSSSVSEIQVAVFEMTLKVATSTMENHGRAVSLLYGEE